MPIIPRCSTICTLDMNITNPGFETGDYTGWLTLGTPTINAVEQRTGSYCNSMNSTSDYVYLSLSGLTIGDTYMFSGWVKRTSSSEGSIYAKNFGGGDVISTIAGTTYGKLVIEFTAGLTTAEIGMFITGGIGISYFDDFKLEKILY